jgi:hypothetical protein
MDTRIEFQRLLEDMDRALRRKQDELAELDERLEAAREKLSESEAREMLLHQDSDGSPNDSAAAAASEARMRQDFEELMQEQRRHYEAQLANINEELIVLEANNKSLLKTNERLQFDLDSLRVANEKLRNRTQTLNESLEEVQSANFELNIRLAKAESQSKMQQKLLKKSHEQDEILMKAFNSKLESLENALAARDKEIKRLRQDGRLMFESLGITTMGTSSDEQQHTSEGPDAGRWRDGESETDHDPKDLADRRQVPFIKNLLREKDVQISQLHEQLEAATKELENNASLIETLKSEKNVKTIESQTTTTIESTKMSSSEKELGARCKMLEVELDEKDKQLHWLERRNRHFECVLPQKIVNLIEILSTRLLDVFQEAESGQTSAEKGHLQASLELISQLNASLNELLREMSSTQKLADMVDQLQRIVSSRDEQIKRLVRELNEMNLRLNRDQLVDHGDDVAAMNQPPEELASLQTEPTSKPGQDVVGNVASASNIEKAQESDTDERRDETEVLSQQVAGSVVDDRHTSGTDAESPETETETKNLFRSKSTQTIEAEKKMAPVGADTSCSSIDVTNDSGEPGGHTNGEQNSIGQSRTAECDELPTTKINRSSSFLLNSSAQKAGTSVHSRDNSQLEQILMYQNRVRQLENENQLLELAMKEILLSIKWSDTRCSTILIDCPSLEQLCQLIEARYVVTAARRESSLSTSGYQVDAPLDRGRYSESRSAGSEPDSDFNCDLFQFIVMKSELDILRGQNEQLRYELKLRGRDWRIPASKDRFDQVSDAEDQYQDEQNTATGMPEKDTPHETTCDMECQTDSLVLIDIDKLNLNQERMQTGASEEKSSKKRDKCQKCYRLVRLANHLLDCIVRIEARVNSSDESFMSKLLALYQLTQKLSKDLLLKDATINQLKLEIHSISQQKVLAETKLYSMESHLEIHSTMCPLSDSLPKLKQPDQSRATTMTNTLIKSVSPENYVPNRMGRGSMKTDPSRSLAIVQEPRITIALLKSIIGCLQARLDYKDERLSQLERMLVAS